MIASIGEKLNRPSESLTALGGSVLALACVPKVSASISVDASESTATEKGEAEPVAHTDELKPARAPIEVGGERPGPPQIIRVEQLTANLLRIHFSEPIAPIGNLDPNDFRVSMLSIYVNQAAANSYAYYYDWGYQMYGQAMRFIAARAGSIQLDLEFEPAMPLYNCRMIERAYDYSPPGVQSQAGLFLHYAAGSIPLRDEAGTPLQNFGADWVLGGRSDPPQTRLDLTPGQIPQAGRTLAKIHCGAELPPGPR